MIKKLFTLFLILLLPSFLFAGETYVDGQTNDGHIIQDEGTTIAQQPILNFIGGGVSVTNSSTTGKTLVTINGTSGDTLDTLSDVNTSGATISDTLIFNGTTWGVGASGGATISNATYGSTWDSVTTIAPSKNAIYDAGFLQSESDPIVKAINGIIKSNGSTISAASAGTDYYNASNQIDHDQTTNYSANKHIDHTGVTLTAGSGLSGGGDISTNRSFALDTSEVESLTWGTGSSASFAWTFNLSGTDVTVTFGSNKITFSGDLEVQGDVYVTDVFVTNIDGDSYVLGKLAIGKTTPSYPLDVVGAVVADAATIDTLTLTNPLSRLFGGNGYSSYPAGSIIVTTTVDTLTFVYSNLGTKVLTNTNGVWSLETPSAGISNVVEDTTPELGGDLSLNGHNLDFPTTANISDVLDEDNMVSNSATKLSTQQSIKAYVDTKTTETKCLYWENPVAGDDFKSIWVADGYAVTLTRMWGESDQTVVWNFQVDDGSPADVNSADLTMAAGTVVDGSLDGDTTMASGDTLDLKIASVSNTPTWASVCFTCTKD